MSDNPLYVAVNSARVCIERFRVRPESTYLLSTALQELDDAMDLLAAREHTDEAAIERAADALFQNGILDDIATDADEGSLGQRDCAGDAHTIAALVLNAAKNPSASDRRPGAEPCPEGS